MRYDVYGAENNKANNWFIENLVVPYMPDPGKAVHDIHENGQINIEIIIGDTRVSPEQWASALYETVNNAYDIGYREGLDEAIEDRYMAIEAAKIFLATLEGNQDD